MTVIKTEQIFNVAVAERSSLGDILGVYVSSLFMRFHQLVCLCSFEGLFSPASKTPNVASECSLTFPYTRFCDENDS